MSEVSMEDIKNLISAGGKYGAPRPQDYWDGKSYAAYDQALSEWYLNTSAAIESGEISLDDLRDADVQLFAMQGYNAGDLDAEAAQQMWDEAFYSRYTEGEVDQLTGQRTATTTIDDNGNVVVSYASGDGFQSGTETHNRVVFGETDTSNYQAYANTTMAQYEQFDRGFVGSLQGFGMAMASNPAGALILGVATGGVTNALGSAIAGSSIGSTIGAAASQAAAASIVSAATQLAITGEIDPASALTAAIGSYISAGGFGEAGSALSDTAVGELVDSVSGAWNAATDTLIDMADAVATGNDVLSAAIQAGGATAISQFVVSGEVDPLTVLAAATAAGFSEYDAQQAIQDGLQEIEATGEYRDYEGNTITREEWQDLQANQEFEDWLVDQEYLDGELDIFADTTADDTTADIGSAEFAGFGDEPAGGYGAPSIEGTSAGAVDVEGIEAAQAAAYEESADFVGPSSDLAADYDPNSEFGQFMDNLSQEDVLTSVVTSAGIDPATGQLTGYTQELDGSYALYKPEDGPYQIVDLTTGNTITYRGGLGNPYEPGSTQYNIWEELDPLTRHYLAGGQLPESNVTTVQIDDFVSTAEPAQPEQPVETTTDQMTDIETTVPGGAGPDIGTAGSPGSGIVGSQDATSGGSQTTTEQPSTAGGGLFGGATVAGTVDTTGTVTEDQTDITPTDGTGTPVTPPSATTWNPDPAVTAQVVNQAYADILGRDADQAGFDYWTTQYNNNQIGDFDGDGDSDYDDLTGAIESAAQAEIEANIAGAGGAGTGEGTAGGDTGDAGGADDGVDAGGVDTTPGASTGNQTGSNDGVGGGTEGESGGGVGPGSGGQGGTGLGGSGSGGDGMLSQRPFQTFMTGISYQAPTIQQIVQNPQTDYTASLNDIINRNSGMFA